MTKSLFKKLKLDFTKETVKQFKKTTIDSQLWQEVIKLERAYGECLGIKSRRRTQQTAKRLGEW